jgi:hypothetical protein
LKLLTADVMMLVAVLAKLIQLLLTMKTAFLGVAKSSTVSLGRWPGCRSYEQAGDVVRKAKQMYWPEKEIR